MNLGNVKFKSCPFCNAKNNENECFLHVAFDEKLHKRFVECDNCGCKGPCIENSFRYNQEKTWLEAIEIWNEGKDFAQIFRS